MEDENGWKHLNLYLLADLYGLGLRNVRKCVFNGAYQVGLREGLEG